MTLLALGFCTANARSQELFYLKNSLDSQAGAANGSARDLLNELLAQPKEVRDAVLEVSQRPDLLVRLKYLDSSTPDAQAKLLAEYPKETADAARTLVSQPALFKKVSDQIVAAGLLGQMYANERETVRHMADQIGAKRAEQSRRPPVRHERLARIRRPTQLRAPFARPSAPLKNSRWERRAAFPTGDQAAYIPGERGSISRAGTGSWISERGGTPAIFARRWTHGMHNIVKCCRWIWFDRRSWQVARACDL
jgi:hypothetical protein